AAVQFDVEARHHHRLGGTDDVGELRVDLRVEVLEVERQHRRPRLGHRAEQFGEHDLDHAILGRSEVAALDARVEAAVAAEEIVDHGEHQARLEHHQRI